MRELGSESAKLSADFQHCPTAGAPSLGCVDEVHPLTATVAKAATIAAIASCVIRNPHQLLERRPTLLASEPTATRGLVVSVKSF
ncbi:MAG: hypothetical protein JWR36_1951 [Glaciihabitans sp.]|jgi:hypothetical protein|nr:hypothetical protein [Glaciihabitans sp.]